MLVRIHARTAWTKAALAVLADGEWHPRQHVTRVGAGSVPPGVAYRHGEKERSRLRVNPGSRVRGEEQTSMETGAWDLVRENLTSLIAHGKLERATVNGVDCLRLTRITTAQGS